MEGNNTNDRELEELEEMSTSRLNNTQRKRLKYLRRVRTLRRNREAAEKKRQAKRAKSSNESEGSSEVELINNHKRQRFNIGTPEANQKDSASNEVYEDQSNARNFPVEAEEHNSPRIQLNPASIRNRFSGMTDREIDDAIMHARMNVPLMETPQRMPNTFTIIPPTLENNVNMRDHTIFRPKFDDARKAIGPFDGNCNDTVSWLQNFHAFTSGLSDTEKRLIILANCSSGVRNRMGVTFDLEKFENYSTSAVLNWIKTTFYTAQSALVAASALQALTWNASTEKFSSFLTNFEFACKKELNMNEDHKKLSLYGKLPDSLKYHAQLNYNSWSYAQLVQYITENENFKFMAINNTIATGATVASVQSPTVNLESNNVNAIDRAKGSGDRRTDRTHQPRKFNNNRSRESKYCQNCRTTGHSKNECKRPFSSFCKRMGHVIENCYTKEKYDKELIDKFRKTETGKQRSQDSKSEDDPREKDTREKPRKVSKNK